MYKLAYWETQVAPALAGYRVFFNKEGKYGPIKYDRSQLYWKTGNKRWFNWRNVDPKWFKIKNMSIEHIKKCRYLLDLCYEPSESVNDLMVADWIKIFNYELKYRQTLLNEIL